LFNGLTIVVALGIFEAIGFFMLSRLVAMLACFEILGSMISG